MMKDKILISIDGWFLHFGIAKILQEKYDCELYSIIDIDDKAKIFFLNQKLVNFQKTWYYLDHISKPTNSPDINYLKSIEEKYKINLWSIAYSDATFYKYNIHYKFSSNEILSILEGTSKFLEKILDEVNPDFLLTYVPNTHYQNLLYQLCRARGVKILTLGPIRFGNRMMISEEAFKIDYQDEFLSKGDISSKSENEIQNFITNHNLFKTVANFKKVNFESRRTKRYKSILKFFLLPHTSNYGRRYSNYGKTRWSVFITKLKRSLRRIYRESFINRNFADRIDEKIPYVYFPLHVEPERLFLVDLPFYDNQLTVLTNIVRSLPLGYHLFVKEHPMMRQHAWREISYYKQIMDLPNVRLIHPSVSPTEIIKKSSLVVTIAGSAGQEAAFNNKPSIVFTNQAYSIIPSVYTIKNIEDLPNAIKSSLKKNVDRSGIVEFIDMIEKNSFSIDHRGLTSKFAYRFGFKGPIMDAYLPSNEIESFLKQNRKSIELLTDEHIKKIRQHKEHQSTKIIKNK